MPNQETFFRVSLDLWWTPKRPPYAQKIINHITHFCDWISETGGDAELHLNPWKEASRHEQKLNWAAYAHRKQKAFLSHLWNVDPNLNTTRTSRAKWLPLSNLDPAKSFPESRIHALFQNGFRRIRNDSPHNNELRNVLIVYLMHYGGLRLSEALGLWSEDVTFENGEVIVRIFHPQYGRSEPKKSRVELLNIKYGLEPRNTLIKATDPLFLGWKNSLITDASRYCFEVFFYPTEMAAIFANLWRDYHMLQRVKPDSTRCHPYAFTNKNGQPYSHRMFRKSHRLAVERLGLNCDKELGTTPHGHRHAYGQRLAKAGASPIILKHAMHHSSLESSKTYTEPTAMNMRQSLEDLESRLMQQSKSNSVE
ncbi:gamma-mobile-trio recombinase GmtY [Pseudomonas syringae group genomosp. 3]|uniref:gamma-mobile-trio recombinase GmtY n=2 Tax=Pseudomonas syringae group genomosp. 3 TaxID=251701 RepID=UPI000B1E6598|nr:gamma-mobile-trio recombinase GmtY [Pseudomonas syringae group genomosp. 3]